MGGIRDISANGTGIQLPNQDEAKKLDKNVDTPLPDGAKIVCPMIVKDDRPQLIMTVQQSKISGTSKQDKKSSEADEVDKQDRIDSEDKRKGRRRKEKKDKEDKDASPPAVDETSDRERKEKREKKEKENGADKR